MSPVIHREIGYVFYFVSFDVLSGEPPHVHIGKSRPQPGRDAKIWLNPIEIAGTGRFENSDIQRMIRVVRRQQVPFLEAWNDYRTRIRG